jgi:hypothetical protein
VNHPHPFANYSDLPTSAASENPLQHAPQNSFGRRWCILCRDIRPTKGGSMKNGFRCGLHKAKEIQ